MEMPSQDTNTYTMGLNAFRMSIFISVINNDKQIQMILLILKIIASSLCTSVLLYDSLLESRCDRTFDILLIFKSIKFLQSELQCCFVIG